MRRVGVYIDYSNVYKGARDAFILDRAAGYRGNINPMHLGKRVALHNCDGTMRSNSHTLEFVKVFRGAPDPRRDRYAAEMEAKRAYQWEQWGAGVYRQTLDYGHGEVTEKGVDVRLSTTLLIDAMGESMDVAVLVSADKDFRYALIQIRDLGKVNLEVAIWQARPGGIAVGRIHLQPERPNEPEIDCHLLKQGDFSRVEDTIDYRNRPLPPGWKG